MKALIDTNVAIDVLSGREGCEESLDVLRLCESNRLRGFVTTNIITDIVYVLRRYIGTADAKSRTLTLLSALELIEVRQSDIMNAFDSPMPDYEDAIIAECAARQGMDYIVTRDKKDFRKSPVAPATPKEMVSKLRT